MAGFSTRSRFSADLNRLTVAAFSARAAGKRVLDLSEGNPTRVGLSPTGHELARLLADDALAHYEPCSFGLLSARETIARELASRGFAVPAEHVLLTASTSEAYGYLFKLLCDPGDSVLVPAPSYPLFDVLAQLEQVRLIPYHLQYDGQWFFDRGALARVDARTRAIVVVHPNNPTGSFLKRGELDALCELGLPILSDEVFSEFALRDDPNRVESALAAADRGLVFRLGGLSKACALPQLKLAWTAMAGPAADVEQARLRLEHIADTYLSPGTQVQLALARLLETGDTTRTRILTRVRDNLAVLHAALASGAASVLAVEGGWYAIVRLPALLEDEEWAMTLLEQDGLLVQPGFYFELAGTHVVLSLIVEPAAMREGALRIAARVASLVGG